MPMQDMAITPKQEKAAEVAIPSPLESSQPKYPYNLCLALCEDELQKLKMADLPAVGDMIHVMAMAKVTSVSTDERQGNEGAPTTERRVELQITHLAVENEDEETAETQRTEARRARMYGTTDIDIGNE